MIERCAKYQNLTIAEEFIPSPRESYVTTNSTEHLSPSDTGVEGVDRNLPTEFWG